MHFAITRRLKKLLKYKAKTKLIKGIRKMIDWAKSIGPQKFVYLDAFELGHKDIPKTWGEKLY